MKSSYRFVALLSTVALALGATTAFAHDGGGHHGRGHGDRHGGEILRSALVGSTPTAAGGPTLFGVPPGGAAWTIGESQVRVRADRVRARGEALLLANGTTGPVQMVVAAVFCNDSTTPAFTSNPVPLDPDGDFRVDQDLTTALPGPCLAPAVLVRIAQASNGAPTGAYIAATGGNAPAAAPMS